MKLSAFSSIGLMALTGREPPSRDIYKALVASHGGQFNMASGERMEAQCYARAMGIARRQRRLESSADQRLPTKVCDLLPVLEKRYGLVPGPHDTITQRRTLLAERMQLPTAGTAFDIERALTALLGSDFVAYVTNTPSSSVVEPAACGDWPMNFQRPEIARKIVRLTEATAVHGENEVGFEQVDGPDLEVGDAVVFDVGAWGQMDKIVVAAINSETSTLTAEWVRPHEQGSLGFTHPLPAWTSTKRHATIVVSAEAASDPERRRKVNELMKRMGRIVSTWDVVEAASATTTQLFQLGEPSLSRRTLATITF